MRGPFSRFFQEMIFQELCLQKRKNEKELEKVRKIRSRATSVLTLSKKKRSLFQLRLGDRRLRGLHGCRLGGRRHSDQRTEMQARLEPPGRS